MKNMVEMNRELLLEELTNFEKKKSSTDIPDILNRYLERVAQNGDTIFTWTKLQPLLRRKLDLVMDEFNEKCPTDDLAPLPNVKPFDFDELKSQILESIDSFASTPFTIQRLCELITDPTKHYKRTDKFMRGIEKNILVVSTVEPKSLICDELQYTSTSSFKGLFSSHHSTAILTQSLSSPLSSPSSSSALQLVNGVAEENCENQVVSKPTEDNISDTNEQQKCNLNSSPVSPTSMPLSPTTNSPPNQHLAPLQQLDSFTTVFASTPSTTPLSVVSDLHSYDKPSTLSLITSTHSSSLKSEKLSLTTTNTESDKNQIDSSSETIEPQTDSNDNYISLNVTSNTDKINDSKDSTAESIINEESHNNNIVINADNEDSEKLINEKQEKDEDVVNEEVVKDTSENELTTTSETKTKNILDDSETAPKKQKVISSEIASNGENESSTSTVCEIPEKQEENVSTQSKEADTDDNSNDTDTSTPMDYCGSCYTNNSELISTSSTSLLTSECNAMDAEIDQIEPMDQD